MINEIQHNLILNLILEVFPNIGKESITVKFNFENDWDYYFSVSYNAKRIIYLYHNELNDSEIIDIKKQLISLDYSFDELFNNDIIYNIIPLSKYETEDEYYCATTHYMINIDGRIIRFNKYVINDTMYGLQYIGHKYKFNYDGVIKFCTDFNKLLESKLLEKYGFEFKTYLDFDNKKYYRLVYKNKFIYDFKSVFHNDTSYVPDLVILNDFSEERIKHILIILDDLELSKINI